MSRLSTPNLPFSKSFFLFLILPPLIPTSCLSTTGHDFFSSLQHHECICQHFSALLRLKQGFRFTPFSTTNLSSWNVDKRDCCGWEGIKCDHATGHVISLNLNFFNISGQVDFQTLSRLPTLQILNLGFNSFDPSPIPSAIGQLNELTNLSLSRGYFYGQIPVQMSNLSRLVSLDLSFNGLNGGYFDRILMLPSLIKLDLSDNNLSSVRLDSTANISSFRSLTQLFLRNCSISGPLPSWVANLTTLENLDFSDNSFSGSIPFSYGNALLNVKEIYLSNNLLSGTIPTSLLSLPSLQHLFLYNNRLGGQLGELHNASSSQLEFIDLTNNIFQGKIPRSIFQLRNLGGIFLGSNNFSDVLDLRLFINLTELSRLSLAKNNFSIEESNINSTTIIFPYLSFLDLRSCNMKRFPNFLKKQENLGFLDLSCNKIDGEIPEWIWRVGSLFYLNLSHNALQVIETPILQPSLSSLGVLDLSSNLLQGFLPIPSSLLSFFSVFNNSFSGEVPIDICSLKFLKMLDISSNNFSGHVPQCFGEMSHVLTVLNLRGNAFSGNLSQTFKQDCSLEILDLSENQFEGEMPTTLANCTYLMVLHLGNNQICDTFPWWIPSLTELRVLILRCNNFHGPIEISPSPQNLSDLHIIDLSFNNFNGSIPSAMFWGWRGMVEEDSKLEYLKMAIGTKFAVDELHYYYEPVIVSSKRLKMYLTKIPIELRLVDLSRNDFQGQIPESIGTLKALQILNMSHNGFTGRIPASLKNLTKLESLDLSQNNLSGKIPQEMSELTFLAVLNLSQNQLTGDIPYSKQFLTFTNESFQGNSGLCGPPLSKACEEETNDSLTATYKDEDDEYDWKMIAVGFGIGYGVGIGVFSWTLVLWRRGRRAYCKFVHKMLLLIFPSAM